MQADVQPRVAHAQLRHFFGQNVACFSVCGGNAEGAVVFFAELFANTFEVGDFPLNDVDALEDVLAWFGNAL